MSNVTQIRGVIQHRARAKQIVDFRHLLFGNITPTDIDGLIEYKNRCFLLIELKHMSNPEMGLGQRMALERLCLSQAKPTLLLLGVHDAPAHEDIDAAAAVVHRYFWRGNWRTPRAILTIREAAEWFFEEHGTPHR